MTQHIASHLDPSLIESVLQKLGLSSFPDASLDGLRFLYGAWCANVPFDNVRKLIHVRSGNPGPLPGSFASDFFTAWLAHGTGGTCWSNSTAWHALLCGVGFDANRGMGTMLAAPNIPPNHGTIVVRFGDERYLVDTSILHVDPISLADGVQTIIPHGAWGLRCAQRDGHWYIDWRPLHKVDGFECRLEAFDLPAEEYLERHEQTRPWSPFNYEVTARRNRCDRVTGISFGKAITLSPDGSVKISETDHAERTRVLIEEVGLSEEIVAQLPADVPTPPPPGSKTAAARSAA